MSRRKKVREALNAIRKPMEPRHEFRSGVITSVSKNDGGRNIDVTARIDGVEFTMPATNRPNEMAGAPIIAQFRGAGDTSPRIFDVLAGAPGAEGGDHSYIVNTPSFELVSGDFPKEIETPATGDAGTIFSRVFIPVNQIPEQHNHNRPTRYFVELRRDTGETVGSAIGTREAPMIAGELTAGLNAGASSFTVQATTLGDTTPPITFPQKWLVVEIEDEKILCSDFDPATNTFTVSSSPSGRGWDSTSDTSHSSGALVKALTMTVAVDSLRPNRAYEAKVFALCGRQRSNDSAWQAFTTEQDTTAPDWSGGAANETPTVTESAGLVEIEWNAATVDASDLARYELDISDDGGSTWLSDSGAQLDVGKGPFYNHDVDDATTRKYRVRAVDTSENESAWTAIVTATFPVPSWSGSRGLTVEATPEKFVGAWSEADTDAGFLGHYEWRHSDDAGSTWSSAQKAGTATAFVLQTTPGDTRLFQVRVVDWAGNAGSWGGDYHAVAGELGIENALDDPSIERDLSEWNGFGGKLTGTRDSGQVRDGSYSMKVVCDHTQFNGAGDVAIIDTDGIAINPGDKTIFELYVYRSATDGEKIRARLLWNISGGTQEYATEDVTVPTDTGTWHKIRVESIAPADVVSVDYQIYITGDIPGTTDSVFYVDSVLCGYPARIFWNTFHNEESLSVLGQYRGISKLRGLYTFSSLDANDDVRDMSNQSRHLTNQNSADFGRQFLLPYGDLNGSNQYFSRSDEAGYDITGRLTVGIWAKFDALGSFAQCIGKGSVGTGYSYVIYKGDDDKIYFRIYDSGGSSDVNSTATVETGTWYFLAGRYIPSTSVRLYVDETTYLNETSIKSSIQNTSAGFTIGSNHGGALYLDGKVALGFVAADDIGDPAVRMLYNKSRHLLRLGAT